MKSLEQKGNGYPLEAAPAPYYPCVYLNATQMPMLADLDVDTEMEVTFKIRVREKSKSLEGPLSATIELLAYEADDDTDDEAEDDRTLA